MNHTRSVVRYEDVSDGEEGEVQASGSGPDPVDLEQAECEEPVRVPPLRLRVLEPHRSHSIPEAQTILILDLQEPVTIGRDRVFGPSLRLKEMEVSKTHLTLFSDPVSENGPGWYLVDNASTLGTFVSSRASSGDISATVRLSQPKQASQPVRLSHLESASLYDRAQS